MRLRNGPTRNDDLANRGCANTPQRSCVIVVGSTGTGKSSTIGKVTGLPVKSGSGYKSITRVCEIYSTPGNDDLIWVDTTGWDDLDGQDDVEIFQSILQLINRHDLTSVRAILWTIHPGSIRQDTTLDRQAKLINQFADKEIWDNVIIICKQALNPEHEAVGSMKAAYQFNPMAKFQVIGYRYLEDPTMTSSQRLLFQTEPEVRRKMNVVDDDEVREILMQKLNAIQRDVQIIFNSFRCLNCGVEGDKRLLPQFCHMHPQQIHPGNFLTRHPAGEEPFHPSPHFTAEHPGHLVNTRFAGCLCQQKKRLYTCCKGEDNAKGCMERWACCRRSPDDKGCRQRYICCKQDQVTATKGCETVYSCCLKSLESQGCQTVCQKCGAIWGTASKECFRTSHELVELI